MNLLKETFENFKATFSPESVASWGEHMSEIKVNLTWDFQEEGLVLDGIGKNPYIFPGVSTIDVIQYYEYKSGQTIYSQCEVEDMMHDMIITYWNDHKEDLMVVSETGHPVYALDKITSTKKYLNGQLIWRA